MGEELQICLEPPAVPTWTPYGDPGTTAARASPGPPTPGKLLWSGSGSGRVPGQRKRSTSPRPTLCGLTVLTPGHYTHHVSCPHLIQTLQRVVDEVSVPMWMPGQCSGTTPILVWGPSRPRAGAPTALTPKVEVYPTCMETSRRWSYPPRSTRRYRLWGITIWGIYTPRITKLLGSGP